MYICEFCNKNFSTKGNLKQHQQKTKTCLVLRNDLNDKNKKETFNCEHCSKILSCRYRLEQHLEICKIRINYSYEQKISEMKNSYESTIEKLENQVKELQDRIERLCNKVIERPSITHNIKTDNHSITNTYNHLQPINLSYDHLYQVLDKNLKIEHIYQGQIGLANVVANNLLIDENGKPLAFCNDKSRQIIKYKNEGGEIIKDVKAYNLVSSIAPVAEQIAMKRKKEFEVTHYTSPKNQHIEDDDELIIDEEKSDEEFFGFEDEEEFEETIHQIQKEDDTKKKKEKVETVIKCIDNNDKWDDEKKSYFLQKLVRGISDLKILNVNPTLFSKQLSMVLPSEIKSID